VEVAESARKHGIEVSPIPEVMTMSDVEKWLDDLDPNAVESHDAVHIRAIREAARIAAAGQDGLLRAVAAARTAGESWTVIGVALGVTRQAAQERFGRRIAQAGDTSKKSA
jgi:predicted polyphosphate/ATP-dependent NAD kinase